MALTDRQKELIETAKARRAARSSAAETRYRQSPEGRTTPEIEATPEFGAKVGDVFKMGYSVPDFARDVKADFLASLATEPKEQAMILQSQLPNSEAFADEKGNWWIDYDHWSGERRREPVNKPGFSHRDLSSFSVQALAATPAGRATAMGGTLGGRALMGAVTGGWTQYGLQKAQEAAGGEFNRGDIAMDAFFSMVPEFAQRPMKNFTSKFSPGLRRALNQKGTLADMAKEGMTRADIEDMIAIYRQSIKDANALKIKGVIGAVAVAGERKTKNFNKPLANLLEVGARDESFARELLRRFDRMSVDSEAAARSLMKRISKETDPLKAVEGLRSAADDVISARVGARSLAARKYYDEAFEGVGKIDLEPLRGLVDDLLKETAPETPAEKQLLKFRKMLVSREHREAMNAVKNAPPELAGEIPIPPNEVDPRILQEVNWVLRDIQKLPQGKSTVGSVKYKARQLEDAITETLDLASGGKRVGGKVVGGRYSKADARFRMDSKEIEGLMESLIGSAAEKKDLNLPTLVKSIFRPDPTAVGLSTRFKNVLQRQNPQAWKDFYAAYIYTNLDNLPDDVIPSDIHKAIFGTDEKIRNMVLELAPDDFTKGALTRLERLLRKTVGIDKQVSLLKGAKAETRRAFYEGWKANLFQIFTPMQSTRRFGERVNVNDKMKILFESALNKEWAKELDSLLKLPLTEPEIVAKYDSFFARMLPRMRGRSWADSAWRAAFPAAMNEKRPYAGPGKATADRRMGDR